MFNIIASIIIFINFLISVSFLFFLYFNFFIVVIIIPLFSFFFFWLNNFSHMKRFIHYWLIIHYFITFLLFPKDLQLSFFFMANKPLLHYFSSVPTNLQFSFFFIYFYFSILLHFILNFTLPILTDFMAVTSEQNVFVAP